FEPSREPFGPPGVGAGRDIDAADDAAAATAGTAEADQVGQEFEVIPHRPQEGTEVAMGESASVAPQRAPEVIDIPEAPEDRMGEEEAWGPRPERRDEPAGASLRFGGAASQREDERETRPQGPARESDS